MKRITKKKLKQSASPTLSYSRSFDNGDILPQKISGRNFREYIVQSSITDIPFEEYVVCKSGSPAEKNARHLIPRDKNDPVQEPRKEMNNPLNNKDKSALLDSVKIQDDAVAVQPSPPPADQPVKKETPASSPFEYIEPDYKTAKAGSDDDNFVKDMQAIFNGEKVFNADTKTVEQKSKPSPPPQQAENTRPVSVDQLTSQHAIFDQIARSMEYAKAYDLGSIDLDKRFSDFDKIEDIQKSLSHEKKSPPVVLPKANPVSAAGVGNEEFLRDLDSIAGLSKTSAVPATVIQPVQPSIIMSANQEHDKYIYESPSLVISSSVAGYSYAQTPALIGGIAVADAVQIGLGAAAVVQAQVSATQGGFTLSYDKAQRMLTNEARIQMPGAQQTKQSYSRELFWIGELKKGFADASVIIQWEGNPYGEIGTAVIRRDIQHSTEWTKSSANTTITKVDRIPMPGTDPRTWPLVYTYDGTFDPAGNGHFEYSGEFEINAFGGLRFIRHEVVNRSLIEWTKIGKAEDYVKKGADHIVPVPAIPKEQIDYLRSRLP